MVLDEELLSLCEKQNRETEIIFVARKCLVTSSKNPPKVT